MKIVSNKSWNALQEQITDKDKQIVKLWHTVTKQQRLIEAQRRFISAHVSWQDIDFPNSEGKGVYESSNIFDL